MRFSEAQELQQFLDKKDSATIAVPIDLKGTIHAASLRFWNNPNNNKFYFVTSINTEKCTLLKSEKKIPCACVVGTVKGADFTLQMRGDLTVVEKETNQSAIESYYHKRGNRHDDIDDPDNVLLEFSPNWARYTDYSAGYQRTELKLI